MLLQYLCHIPITNNNPLVNQSKLQSTNCYAMMKETQVSLLLHILYRWRRSHRGSVRLKPATAQTAPFEKLRREEEKEEVNEESQEEMEMESLVEEDKEYYYFEDPSNIGKVCLIAL